MAANDMRAKRSHDGAQLPGLAVTPEPVTVVQRRDLGKSRRKQLPCSALVEYVPATDRADPVALLEAQAFTRVSEPVPIRYDRTLAWPFWLYREGRRRSWRPTWRPVRTPVNRCSCVEMALSR